MHSHYIDPDDLWMFAESIKNVKDIDGQKATDFIFLLYKADCGPISCESNLLFSDLLKMLAVPSYVVPKMQDGCRDRDI